MKSNIIYKGDNLAVLNNIPSEYVDLIYIDPPFNTGHTQSRTRLKTSRNPEGDRVGFQGYRYKTEVGETTSFEDSFMEYLEWLSPRLREAYRVLKPTGTLYFHIDYREVHYCKLLLDEIFGRDCFLNEIIWAYDYGAKSKSRWPAKHDNILVYVKDKKKYTFNTDAIDRIPYMAPNLVGPEKAARGKLPTDVWWQTIVPPGGKESTGYVTQKPETILKRIISTSSNPGDLILDFFAGSGTTAKVALDLERYFIVVDNNDQAIEVMKQRLASPKVSYIDYYPVTSII